MLIVECLAFNGKIVDNIDYSIIQLFNYSIIQLFNYSIIQLFNYSIIQLFNYSIIVSLSVLIGAFRHRMLHNLRMLASV